MSLDSLGCHTGKGLWVLVSRPILLNFLPYTREHLLQRISWLKMSKVLRLRSPTLKCRVMLGLPAEPQVNSKGAQDGGVFCCQRGLSEKRK